MNVAEQVYERVRELPEPLAREVLDFVAFLSERRDAAPWRDLSDAQSSGLASTWNNAEDAIWDAM